MKEPKTIAVITYDSPHRKTQDIILRLIMDGYNDIVVYALPWIKRKPFYPLYYHRPGNAIPVYLYDYCHNLPGIHLIRVDMDLLAEELERRTFKHIIIGGAGILPKEVVKDNRFANHRKIINSHPGYLPDIRGLDSYKWAILKGGPIGVTVHYIDREIDRGMLIAREIVPVYFEDTFHSVAQRLYNLEINLLVKSLKGLSDKFNFMNLYSKNEINRRMPHYLEIQMIERFEGIRKRSPSIRS